ncbi:DUF413 domain-containing protein [Neiella sp. HB171785]|uniref:Macrodomain Ori protein n=1 Tax=Neiella litorisoli TaxID=2771431 RepID=A0A8J6QI69_9GAMM|nr:DUF413 domain-containing protein [Neiella litorisoli]MBD1388962.1 DUF413 domain-containing protein [Neiella litorisoli]
MNTQIRQGATRFYDNQKFARGFQKSGDFTLKESDLLTRYGTTLAQLENGQLQPENAEEQQFVSVIHDGATAQSDIEKVWLKYLRLTKTPRRFHAVTSYRRNTDYIDANLAAADT